MTIYDRQVVCCARIGGCSDCDFEVRNDFFVDLAAQGVSVDAGGQIGAGS